VIKWVIRLRKAIGYWLIGKDQHTPQVIKQRRKLEIYKALSGQTIGESIELLSEVILESSADEVFTSDVQKNASAIAAIRSRMRFPDFIYLLASALHYNVSTTLTSQDNKV
jgi:hypothetical protein